MKSLKRVLTSHQHLYVWRKDSTKFVKCQDSEKLEESHSKQSDTKFLSCESITWVLALQHIMLRLLGFCFRFLYQFQLNQLKLL